MCSSLICGNERLTEIVCCLHHMKQPLSKQCLENIIVQMCGVKSFETLKSAPFVIQWVFVWGLRSNIGCVLSRDFFLLKIGRLDFLSISPLSLSFISIMMATSEKQEQ